MHLNSKFQRDLRNESLFYCRNTEYHSILWARTIRIDVMMKGENGQTVTQVNLNLQPKATIDVKAI